TAPVVQEQQTLAATQQAAQQGQSRFFHQGVFQQALFEKELMSALGAGGVLSANGLGAATDWFNIRKQVKKVSQIVSDAYALAVAEAKRTGAAVHDVFLQYVRAGFAVRLQPAADAQAVRLQQTTLNLLTAGNFAQPGEVRNPLSSQEVFDFSRGDQTPVGGFRLTYANPATQTEEILPVALSIDRHIKTDKFDRMTFDEKFHAQLRNGGAEPVTMSHFFLKFAGTPAEFKAFVRLAQQADLSSPLHIKLQHRPNQATKTRTFPLYDATGRLPLPVQVEIQKKLVPGEARLVLDEEGRIGLLRPFADKSVPLQDLYIRLPKHQIKTLVQILKNSKQVFPVEVLRTENKASILYRDQQLYNNSLGKTMGPIIHHDLGMSAAAATNLMMVINYVIPGLASLLNPVLRRLGEKRLSVIAGFMTSLANFLPPLVGFYGVAREASVSNIAIGVVVSAFVMRSVASVLQQVTSNMLVDVNSGKVPVEKKKTDKKDHTGERVTWKDITQRMKDVWKTQASTADIRNLLMYNLSFVFKNFGTLLFLAIPWMLNKAWFLATGTDGSLVYSISFPLFGAYALFITLRTLRANLRDAYTVPTVEGSLKDIDQQLGKMAFALKEELGKESTTAQAQTDLLEKQAQDLLANMDNVLQAYRRVGTKKKDLPALREQLLIQFARDAQGKLSALLPQEQAQALGQQFSDILLHMEKNPVTAWQVLLHAPSVALITIGMTLATVHEFTVSSAFSMNLNQLMSNEATANLLVAVSLYVPLILGRLGGNLVASRISSGTMYLLCNAVSGLGTLLMLSAVGNVPMSILGAAITSLGVGNYFSQMYDFVTKKNPKLKREISVILAVTMAAAGLLTIPASHLNAWFGMQGLDLWYAAGALVLSWLATLNMTASSSLVKFFKTQVQDAKDQWHNKKQTPQDPTAGPDMKDPLPN
ncbi:hypothetical protein, partial [Candidatus Avelusimicrobium facis]|uniref:hypothetical protein n=1 Tax=Candidatus Avelusimicrobium facis TaxID=3416203 RepID=UPI003D0E9E13